ncbi:MAG: DUF177 domain-containing protein [Nitrospirota bacterium]|nr:DUF177 domain-containing protein [Nitrospirota bacterium]
MKIALSQVPPEGLQVSYAAGPELFADAGDGVVAQGSVPVAARVDTEGSGLRVKGSAEAVLELPCARCLNVFPAAFITRFDVLFTPIALDVDADEIELGERDMAVCHLEGDVVDLDGLVREQVLLELPMAPLCDEGCRGLCPRCGADLNLGECGCPPQGDPRLAALKKLLEG